MGIVRVAGTGFRVFSYAGQAANGQESYRLLIGPVLAPGGRAIAIVTPASVSTIDGSRYSVLAIEADIDDESGRVQLTFEISCSIDALAGATEARSVGIDDVAYQVTIHGTAAA